MKNFFSTKAVEKKKNCFVNNADFLDTKIAKVRLKSYCLGKPK